MTRAIPTTDSSDAVDLDFLIPTFEPGDNPANTDPVPQSVLDIVRSVFTSALEARAANAISREEAIDTIGTALSRLGEFSYDPNTDTFTFVLPPASTSKAGVVEKATAIEMRDGTADKYPDAALVRSFANSAVGSAVDIQYRDIATGQELTAALTTQQTSDKPLLIRMTSAVNVTFQGLTYNYVENQVAFLKPRSASPTRFFVLPDGSDDSSGSGSTDPPTNIGSGVVSVPMSQWVSFPTTEALDDNREYQVILQRGSDGTATVATPVFWGSQVPVNAGGAFSRNDEPNQLGMAVGRIEEGGAVGLSMAKDGGNDRNLRFRCFLNGVYSVKELLKLPARGGSSEDSQGHLTYVEIGSLSQFLTAVRAQETKATPTLMLFNVAVDVVEQSVRHQYQVRELAWFAPGATTGVDLFSVPRGYVGKVEITPPNIAAATDLDGSYQVVLSDVDVAGLTASGVNVLEIWFGDESVQTVSPWAPVSTDVITAVVDTTEETQIGSVGDVVRVRAVFREDGTYVGEIGTSLTVGGESADGLTSEQSAAIDALPPFSTIMIEPRGIPSSDYPPHFDFVFIDRITSKTITAASITIGLYTIAAHSSTPLSRLANNTARLRFAFTEDQRSTLSANVGATDSDILGDLTLTYSDGTTHRHRFLFLLNDPAFSSAKRTIVAAVAGSDTAGVASFALPSDYENYNSLIMSCWENDSDRIVTKTIPTAVIAIAANNQVFTIGLSGRQGDRDIQATWTTANRTFTITSPERCIFAELRN